MDLWEQAAQVGRMALLVGGVWVAASLPLAVCLGRALRRAEPPGPDGTGARRGVTAVAGAGWTRERAGSGRGAETVRAAQRPAYATGARLA